MSWLWAILQWIRVCWHHAKDKKQRLFKSKDHTFKDRVAFCQTCIFKLLSPKWSFSFILVVYKINNQQCASGSKHYCFLLFVSIPIINNCQWSMSSLYFYLLLAQPWWFWWEVAMPSPCLTDPIASSTGLQKKKKKKDEWGHGELSFPGGHPSVQWATSSARLGLWGINGCTLYLQVIKIHMDIKT